VFNLYRATLYFIKVLAVNQVGRGQMSNALDVRTEQAKPIAPGKPYVSANTDPNVPTSTGVTMSTVTFTFPTPSDMGGLPLLHYKIFLWRGSSKTDGSYDEGTVQLLSPEVITNTTDFSQLVKHDGAGWWKKTYTVTFLRLPRNTFFKLKVQAANVAGVSTMSPESALVQTTNIAEPIIHIRLLYEGKKILYDDAMDTNQTVNGINETFVKEWASYLGIPSNRINVFALHDGHIYRLLRRTYFIKLSLNILTTSASSDVEMEVLTSKFRGQTVDKNSVMRTRDGMINRKLDWGYIYIDWGGDKKPIEYIWTLGLADKPEERLSGGAAIALGIIIFVLVPTAIYNWMPFYLSERAKGKEIGAIIVLTIKIWIGIMIIFYLHVKRLCIQFGESPMGKRLWKICCPCLKKKEMRPEDVDPMTGMPFGFDQKYFPDGMPPEAMAKYEENMRLEKERALRGD